MAAARKFIDKKVLHNYIRSTDAHNKIREEQDMWRLRQAQNTQKSDSLASLAATSKRRGRLHSDDPSDSGERNTYWMKQLTEFESSCTDRWGHSGYKELYPEEFASNFTDSDDDSEDEKKKKKKTSKKRKKSSSKDERKRKSKKIRTVQSSDSETELNQEKRKRRKRTKDKTSRKSKTEKRKKGKNC
ncbi:predicted protein [Nematostella vectensis]|uniref:Uncharacterized protein n=1 Tax=Nematostella vectensis TaxID=45351 RepID=A7RWQ3_NEMVE|nr:predicted protein [Nematostella vectensis]|eukprot:XP_001636134.1 predicted protein [Nematostella vectensis]